MKKYFLFLFIISCTKQISSSVNSGNITNTNTSTTLTTGSQASCTGTTADGVSLTEYPGQLLSPIHVIQASLSGGDHQGSFDPFWSPGQRPYATDTGYRYPIMSKEMGLQSFQNDGPYYIKIKVLPHEIHSDGVKGCYDRALNQTMSSFNYTKLRFQVYARAYVRNSSGQIITNNNTPAIHVASVGPIDVNSCSPVIKIPSFVLPNVSNGNTATFFEIRDVKTDQFCQQGGDDYDCPAEVGIRRADCWRMDIMVSTNQTVEFKGNRTRVPAGN